MTTQKKLIQPKFGVLKLAEKLGNISEAYRIGAAHNIGFAQMLG